LLGLPRGAWLIVGVEFWERFSFYAMLGLLALFLTGTQTRGGFGWPDAPALGLVGLYTGLMYALPAFGGYLADRVLGRRRAVTCGLVLMLTGQVLMVSPFFIPAILGSMHDAPLADALRQLGEPLGYLIRTESIDAALAASGAALDASQGVAWLTQAYTWTAIGFSLAIVCMVLGNALMKSTLVVLCGETLRPDDPKRDSAFTYYYLGICIGGVVSGLATGIVADRYGWVYAFSLAIVGVTTALCAYLFLAGRWLGNIGLAPERKPAAASAAVATPGSETTDRVLLLFTLSLLILIFSAGWFQLYGTWTLFIEREVDRMVGSFMVPVPWFASWNPAVVIIFAPLVAMLYERLGRANRSPDIVQKYFLALSLLTLAHVLMYFASTLVHGGGKAPLWIPTIAIALTAIGELIAWTSTYGLVTRAAPKGYASVAMGAWYFMTLGLGGYLAGVPGGWLASLGYGGTFLAITAIAGSAAVLCLLLRGWYMRLASRAGVTL
jgi:POT family proton-dependent oligopeptide transporter